MKATILTSVFAVLVSVSSLNAKDVKTYNNVESGEAGVKKEYIILDEATSTPISKDYYHYDTNGFIKERIVSVWDSNTGWVNSRKFEYEYNGANKVASIIYTEWDKKKGGWAEQSHVSVNVYNENNEYLSTKQIQIKNEVDNYEDFITQR